jgi:hypothetical protein
MEAALAKRKMRHSKWVSQRVIEGLLMPIYALVVGFVETFLIGLVNRFETNRRWREF